MSTLAEAQRDYLQEPWYSENWLPRYRATVEEAKLQISGGDVAAVLPRLWSERDNSVSSAGQGTMSHADFERNQAFLAQLTRDIAADPSPDQFDRATAALRERVAADQLKSGQSGTSTICPDSPQFANEIVRTLVRSRLILSGRTKVFVILVQHKAMR